jgi:hypothetical protein
MIFYRRQNNFELQRLHFKVKTIFSLHNYPCGQRSLTYSLIMRKVHDVSLSIISKKSNDIKPIIPTTSFVRSCDILRRARRTNAISRTTVEIYALTIPGCGRKTTCFPPGNFIHSARPCDRVSEILHLAAAASVSASLRRLDCAGSATYADQTEATFTYCRPANPGDLIKGHTGTEQNEISKG